MDIIAAVKSLVTAVKGLIQTQQDNPPQATIEGLMIGSAGEISISATRATAHIPINLPFVIFGANDFKASYATLLEEQLQAIRAISTYATLQLVVSVDSSGNVLFTYTLGALSDVITISYVGNLNSYRAYLAAMTNDYFSSCLIIYQISDTGGGAAQLNGVIQFSASSALALAEENEIPIGSCVKPQDNPSNGRVALVFSEQKITPDIGLVDYMIPDAGLTVTYHTYISKRMNMNHVLDKSIQKSVAQLDEVA